MRMRR